LDQAGRATAEDIMLTLMETPPFLEEMEKQAKQLAQAIARRWQAWARPAY